MRVLIILVSLFLVTPLFYRYRDFIDVLKLKFEGTETFYLFVINYLEILIAFYYKLLKL